MNVFRSSSWRKEVSATDLLLRFYVLAGSLVRISAIYAAPGFKFGFCHLIAPPLFRVSFVWFRADCLNSCGIPERSRRWSMASMASRHRNGEFIADLAAHRSGLGKFQMMCITGLALTNHACLCPNISEVCLAASADRLIQGYNR